MLEIEAKLLLGFVKAVNRKCQNLANGNPHSLKFPVFASWFNVEVGIKVALYRMSVPRHSGMKYILIPYVYTPSDIILRLLVEIYLRIYGYLDKTKHRRTGV